MSRRPARRGPVRCRRPETKPRARTRPRSTGWRRRAELNRSTGRAAQGCVSPRLPPNTGDRPRLLPQGVGGRHERTWLALNPGGPRTACRTDLGEVEQQDAADLRHGMRIALHRMSGAHDEFRFNSVKVGTLIGYDAVVTSSDRTVAPHGDNRVGSDTWRDGNRSECRRKRAKW